MGIKGHYLANAQDRLLADKDELNRKCIAMTEAMKVGHAGALHSSTSGQRLPDPDHGHELQCCPATT
jgi:hypothetical protein